MHFLMYFHIAECNSLRHKCIRGNGVALVVIHIAARFSRRFRTSLVEFYQCMSPSIYCKSVATETLSVLALSLSRTPLLWRYPNALRWGFFRSYLSVVFDEIKEIRVVAFSSCKHSFKDVQYSIHFKDNYRVSLRNSWLEFKISEITYNSRARMVANAKS